MMNLPLKNGMVTSLALKPSNFDRKMKSYKYSILKTKVTGVFSDHHLLFPE